MASIRKKSNGMWLAQVRRVARDGLPALNRSASFPRKAEAEAWAAKIENEWRTLRFGGAPNVPFSEVLERYKNEVSVHKHGWRNETNIINRVLRTPLAEVRLPHLSELQFQAWADERKKEVSASTLRREWVLLSNVLTVASKQWRWLPENFMQRLDKPADGLARTQRVTDEDAAAVAFAGGYTPDCVPSARTQRAAAAFYFALETAMRAGEIVMLTWDCVFYDRRYVHIPLTKNGHPRNVPLSSKAVAILRQMETVRENAFVFNITSGSLDALFRKLKRRSLLENLHFHDARREALTRLAKIYSPMELAKISGHRDLRILLNTYYAPTVEDLAEKLE